MKRHPSQLALLLALALVSSACRYSGSYQTVPMPDQSVELEEAHRSRVYVVRSDEVLWRRVPLHVDSGTERIATLGTGSYLCWEREPGRVMARLILERPEWEGGPLEQFFDVHLEPGQVAWVEITIDQDDMRLVPERLEPEAGRALVANSTPARVR